MEFQRILESNGNAVSHRSPGSAKRLAAKRHPGVSDFPMTINPEGVAQLDCMSHPFRVQRIIAPRNPGWRGCAADPGLRCETPSAFMTLVLLRTSVVQNSSRKVCQGSHLSVHLLISKHSQVTFYGNRSKAMKKLIGVAGFVLLATLANVSCADSAYVVDAIPIGETRWKHLATWDDSLDHILTRKSALNIANEFAGKAIKTGKYRKVRVLTKNLPTDTVERIARRKQELLRRLGTPPTLRVLPILPPLTDPLQDD
jgi:hypothetical protein